MRPAAPSASRCTIPAVAMVALAALLVVLSSGARADTPVQGLIDRDVVWGPAGSPYVVTANVTVAGYDGDDGLTTLTILPGTEVRFQPGTQLQIGDCCADTPGALVATGSPAQPIRFTSNKAPAFRAPGDWSGIYFHPGTDSTSRIQSAIVEYGGKGGRGLVRVEDSQVTLRDNMLQFSAGYGVEGTGRWGAPAASDNVFASNALEPIRVSPWGAGFLGSNDYAANGPERSILVIGDRLEASATWHNPGAPYHVVGLVVITGYEGPQGATKLTVGQGVQVNFSQGSGIDVGQCCWFPGALETQGTPAEPVVFTSHQPAASKTPGFWDRIRFLDSASDEDSSLVNTVFEYGGREGRGMVELNDAAPRIASSTFQHSPSYGLYADGATSAAPVVDVTFDDNGPAHALLQPNGVGLFQGNQFPHGGEVRVAGGDVSLDATWTDQGVPYNATGSLYVGGSDGPDGHTILTLDAGVRLWFPAGAFLDTCRYPYAYYGYYYCYSGDTGVFSAQGTEESPVTLTSWESIKTPGRWGGVIVRDHGDLGSLQHLTIEAAGGGTAPSAQAAAALYIARSTPAAVSQVRILQSGGDGVGLECPAAPHLRDVLISGTRGYGVEQFNDYAYGSPTCTPLLENVTLEHGTGRPARLVMAVDRSGLTFADFANPEVELFPQDLYASATLGLILDRDTAAPYAYHLLSGLRVLNDATLTVEPGVRTRLDDYDSITLGNYYGSSASSAGRLIARGTEALPIVFESADPANPWYGLQIYGQAMAGRPPTELVNVTLRGATYYNLYVANLGGGLFDRVTVQDSKQYGVYVSGSTVTLSNLRVVGATTWGVYEDPYSQTTLVDPRFERMIARPARLRIADAFPTGTFSGLTGPREIELWGADIVANTTLSRFTDESDGGLYVYALLGSFTIRQQSTLTVAPGVTVLADDYVGMAAGECSWSCDVIPNVRGAFRAEGTQALPIVFANRTPRSSNSWGGITVDGSGADPTRMPSTFRNVTIAGSRGIGLYVLRHTEGVYDNVTVQDNRAAGLQLYQATLTLTNLVSRRNTDGLAIDGATNPVLVQGATLEDNAGHGVLFLGASNYARFEDTAIRRSGGYGLYAGDGSGSTADLANVRIEGVQAKPWRLSPWSIIGAVALSGNNVTDLEWTAGEVQGGDRTWARYLDETTAQPYTYTVLGGQRWFNQANLTLSPGVTIRFAENAYLDIGKCCYTPVQQNQGGLRAEGTAALPIRLTALVDRARGWYGLFLQGDQVTGDLPVILRNVTVEGEKFADGQRGIVWARQHDNVLLDHATLRDGARNGLYVEGGGVVNASGLVVQDVAQHGVYADGNGALNLASGLIQRTGAYGIYHANANQPGSYLDLRVESSGVQPLRVRMDTPLAGLVLQGNGQRQVEWYPPPGNVLTASFTPPLLLDAGDLRAYAYSVLGSVTVKNGSELTLAPGTTWLMSQDAKLIVGACCSQNSLDPGSLIAVGTQLNPITFGAATGNKSTGWRGLYFDGRSAYQTGGMASLLRNVTLRDSKADLLDAETHRNLTLDRLTFRNATSSGVWTHGTAPRLTLSNANFQGGNYGVFAQNTNISLTDSVFANATINDLYAASTAAASVLERNEFRANNTTAVRFDNGTNDVVFRSNKLTDSNVGLRIELNAVRNLVYNNFFRNSRNNTVDLAPNTTAATKWNITPTLGLNICGGPWLGGNCWSDYAGVDNNNDGIGDTLRPYRVGITGPGDQQPLVARPFPDFTYALADAANGTIQFTDRSTGPRSLVNWTWDFGDGNASYAQNPAHTYAQEALYLVTLTIVDAGGYNASTIHTVLFDTLPPVSTGQFQGLVGNAGWFVSNVTVTLNATDNGNGGVDRILYLAPGLGSFLVYTGPFTLTQDGVNTVEYFAVDGAGNVEPTQYLNVSIDKTPPVTQALLNGTLHAAGWFTTNVTATLVPSDATSGATLTFYQLDGGDVKAYIGNFSVSGTGNHSLAPFSRDVAGNFEGLLNTPVKIDLTPPSSAVQVVSGTPGQNGWWRSAVQVALQGADEGAGVASMVAGLDGGSLNTYTGPVTIGTEGIHTVAHQATDLVDLVGRLAEDVVKVDFTPPSLGVTAGGNLTNSGWYRGAAQIFANGTDGVSGLNATEYQLDTPGFRAFPGSLTITATGSHNFTARATDLAGNLLTLPVLRLLVDNDAPVTGSQVTQGVHGTGIWYRSDVAVRLNAADGLGSGVAGTTFSVDGGANSTYVPGSELLLTGEGQHAVRASSTDLVGLAEGLKTFLFGIDLSNPVTVANVTGYVNPSTGGYWGPATVRLLGSDAVSGISSTKYWINGQGPHSFFGPFTLSLSGLYNITFQSTDLAGNLEPLQLLQLSLELDTTPPTTSIGITGTAGASPWYRSPVRVSLSATDLEVGVGLIQYRLSAADPWSNYTGPFDVSREGLLHFQYRATDLVGNVETPQTKDFGVDLSPPVVASQVAGPAGENGWYAGPVNVTLGALDAASQVQQFQYRINNGAWQNVGAPLRLVDSGVYDISWFAKDFAGNLGQGSLTVRLDTDLPTAVANIAGVPGAEGWWKSAVTVAFDASDPTSGILRVDYSLDGGAFVPYLGPFNLSIEGNHDVRFRPFDLVGHEGLTTTLQLNIDLSTPLVHINLNETLGLTLDEILVVHERLCINVDGLDLVSGLKDLTIQVIGVVNKVVQLDAFISFHCLELPSGNYTFNLIGCDHAGWCGTGSFSFRVDNLPPFMWLVRPTPGSIMVQNVTAPVFRSTFGQDRLLASANASGLPPLPPLPGRAPWPEAVPLTDPFDDHGWPRNLTEAGAKDPRDERGWPAAAPVRDPRDGNFVNLTVRNANDSLARTTIVVGPRVPIWIAAVDDTGVARVDFLLDGNPLAFATQPVQEHLTVAGLEQDNVLDDAGPVHVHLHVYNVTVYEVTVDTLGLLAGEHRITVQARDLLGSESAADFRFDLESAAQGANLAETVAGAFASGAIPDAARTAQFNATANFTRDALRYLGPVLDRHAQENYVFLDQQLFEFEHAWDPVVAAPGWSFLDDQERI